MNECKRCLLYESAELDVLDSVKRCIERISPSEKVSDDIYEQRLSRCRECDWLISGVCYKCGCYVELRAAYKKQCCPNAAQRLWDKSK